MTKVLSNFQQIILPMSFYSGWVSFIISVEIFQIKYHIIEAFSILITNKGACVYALEINLQGQANEKCDESPQK